MYAAATMIRVESELRDALTVLAARADRSYSAEIRRALWRHVELELATQSDNARPTEPSAVQSPAKREPVHAQE